MASKPESWSKRVEAEIQGVREAFESSWNAGQNPTIEGMMAGRSGPIVEPLRRELVATQERLLDERAASTGNLPGLGSDPHETRPLGSIDEPIPGYVMLRRLGSGGFGEVWAARGPGGITVALKFVHLRQGAGQAELRAFETIKGIRHPNLLSPFGAWHLGDRLIIGMELADGTLMDRLATAQADGLEGIPAEELTEYLAEAAKGIDHLNQHRHAVEGGRAMGVQHRDIKPQNILIVGGGVKVADFGLARLLEAGSTGHSGSLTPAYAAPEFFQGQTSDHSDQYSLAITYCHLVGGRLPFVGPLASIINGHVNRPPDLSMVPAVERAVVARALAKSPADRWPNCRAFVTALRAAPEVRRKLRVRRRWLAVGVLGGVAILSGVAIGWRLIGSGTPRSERVVVSPKREPEGPMPWPPESAPTAKRPSVEGSVAADRPTVDAFRAEGDRAFRAGDFDSALVAYSEALRLEPADLVALNNRGGTYYKLGFHDAAIEDFSRAIGLAPAEARPYFNRGTARFASGRHEASILDFTEALRLDPNLAAARINRGLAYRKLNDETRAEVDLQPQ